MYVWVKLQIQGYGEYTGFYINEFIVPFQVQKHRVATALPSEPVLDQ
jgi:hypothetical protein